MKRRVLLEGLGASACFVALSGCTQLSRAIPGCDNMHGTTLDLAPASLTDERLSDLLPLVYADLRPEHQQLVEKASGDGNFKACPPVPKAVDSFVDLVKDRIDRQWNDYGGAPENRPEYLRTAYLERDGSSFELQVYVEDLVISG